MAIVSRTTVGQVLDDIQVRLPHEYIDDTLFRSLNEKCTSIHVMLIASCKTVKKNMNIQVNTNSNNPKEIAFAGFVEYVIENVDISD